MRHRAVVLGLNIFLAVPMAAQHRVECRGANGPDRFTLEAPDLKKAPHGAYRVDKYRLVVNLAKGTRQFVDSAPYMEKDRGGTANQYCDFDTASQMHVLSFQDEFVWGGFLIDDRTGARLPGGQWVAFSPDNRHYMAGLQHDGSEYADWAVYTIAGRLLAKGLAMTCAGPKDYCGGELSNARWKDTTHIEATTTCDGKSVVHTLDVTLGRWRWSPAAPCPTDEARAPSFIVAVAGSH